MSPTRTMRPSVLPKLAALALALAAAGCQLIVDLDGLEDHHCADDEKACANKCVPKIDANTGCALLSCAPCAPPHAKARCGSNGQCILDGCAGDWWDCNGNYDDGCEIDLAHDAHNCDICFTPCKRPAHGIAGCSARMCGIGGCDPGWEDCDGNPDNGCEHEIWTDAECLTCKLPCPDGKHCDQGVCI